MTTVRSEDREGGVRVLTLDRPPANAITVELLDDLSAALEAAGDDDSVRAVVVTGAGRFFSGGLDLSQATTGAPAVGVPLEKYRDSHVALLSFPKPTVGMLNGHAIAGGLVILLACDYHLGVEGDYKIGLNEVAIGASFPKAAFEIVRLRLTHQRASELLLGAGLYPVSEALRLGVVDELLPASTFESTVLRRAARLGSYPKEAYAHTKAALVAEAVQRTLAEPPEEVRRGGLVWGTPESVAARLAQAKKLGKA
jgi:enoyl-CoA hydratase